MKEQDLLWRCQSLTSTFAGQRACWKAVAISCSCIPTRLRRDSLATLVCNQAQMLKRSLKSMKCMRWSRLKNLPRTRIGRVRVILNTSSKSLYMSKTAVKLSLLHKLTAFGCCILNMAMTLIILQYPIQRSCNLHDAWRKCPTNQPVFLISLLIIAQTNRGIHPRSGSVLTKRDDGLGILRTHQ